MTYQKTKNIEVNKSQQKKKYEMLDLSPTISIVTLSINGLNIPIKDRLAEWIGTHDSSISNNDTGRLKVKGGETHILKNY